MVVETEVRIPGVVLAAVLQEVAAAEGDCEGLVVGSVGDRVVRASTDAAEDATKQLVVFYVESFYRCPTDTRSFYDSNGALNTEQLRKLGCSAASADRQQEVIGWWRFRRGLPLTPSVRETAVHDRLVNAQLQAPFTGSARPLFVLFGERYTQGGAIRDTDFRVLVTQDAKPRWRFQQIDPVVTNLVSSSQQEYSSFASSFHIPMPMHAKQTQQQQPPQHVRDTEALLEGVHSEAARLVAEIQQASSDLAALVQHQPH